MRASQTFVNIAQLTTREALWNWGFSSDHSPIAELSLSLEVVTISSAWKVQPYRGHVSSRKQPWCRRHGLSNILKLQAKFLYSIYHQRADKTNLFHMRGGRFHAFNTWCSFKVYPWWRNLKTFRSLGWNSSLPNLPSEHKWVPLIDGNNI